MLKLTFYVPRSHLDVVKEAVFAAGAGRHRNYDCCCWQVPGQGQFRPGDESRPFLGRRGSLTTVEEFRVEMLCAENCQEAVSRALLASHPYEEPAFDFHGIESNRFE